MVPTTDHTGTRCTLALLISVSDADRLIKVSQSLLQLSYMGWVRGVCVHRDVSTSRQL